ncbi:MAG: putative ABC-type transport system involved in lysophospholipase biosynthesis, permease component [Herbinix sp.]|jgi:putative ABC transport system permease protein|nr:putative ABC-type transport system involved in lysophospholipase biosynthesis, permease component [Herbinix sp.]
MKFAFYPKLAFHGVCKNKKLYFPYILTSLGMVMMFYIISFLSYTPVLDHMRGGPNLKMIMGLGSWVIGIFAVIFLFYTNSFLLRGRKKEFGLYNILGMGKFNIGRILLWESIMIGVFSLVIGLFMGVILSKFAELGLVNIIFEDINYDFHVSKAALTQSIILFSVIFILILINGLRQVHLANPVALLHSENVGEKPPKANWVFGILGFLLLGGAYYIAVTIESPLSALIWFFVAVVMVILGTYLIFIAGSVLFCRILQKNKRYYYNPNHFVSISSMVYRMKRNGAGLASICILGTMVLVMITGSACLYFGAEDSLHKRYPRDIASEITVNSIEGLSYDKIDILRGKLEKLINENHVNPIDVLDYRTASIAGLTMDGILDVDVDTNEFSTENFDDLRQIYFIPLEDYNRAMKEDHVLAADQILLSTVRTDYNYDTFTLKGGKTFTIAEKTEGFIGSGDMFMNIIPSIIVVLPDLEHNLRNILDKKDDKDNKMLRLNWFYSFNTDESSAKEMDLKMQISELFRNIAIEENEGGYIYSSYVESLEENRSDFYSTYGGLFFIGIMLSTVFIFATVLIIYYKQISEGFEDQSRFDIMQKVGMSKKDIKKNINSQMLTVFFMPLAAAVIHLSFAFPMIRRLLMLFNLRNLPLLLTTAGISVVIFAIFYSLVYRITSNAYYSIVSGTK